MLAALDAGPRSLASVTDAVAASRATVDRALAALADAGLVADTGAGYVATQAGVLAHRRHRAFCEDDWSTDALALLDSRAEFLAHLAADRAHKPGLVDALGHSRSTVNRAIDALEDAGWVERGAGGYGSTDAGDDALAAYRDYLADQRAVVAAREALVPLPADRDLPLALVSQGDVAAEDARYRLFETLADALDGATRYRAAVPRVVDSRQLRLCQRRVAEDDLAFAFHAPGRVHDRLADEFPHLVSDLADGGDVSVTRGDAPAYGVVLVDDAAGTTAVVVTYDDGVAGVVTATDPAVVAWAEATVDEHRAGAADAGETWATATATRAFPRVTGERLPARLRTEGFVRVDDDFLDAQDPLPPAAAWRAGVGLAAVDAGYAVPRYPEGTDEPDGVDSEPPDDGPRESLATRIRRHLADGEDVALLGPTGSGKSTVCKRVAVQRAREDDGLVLYRESGAGQSFRSPGALAALLERVTGPVLVVVEDAVRAETAPAFEVMQQFRGDDSVSFLVDARASEWNAPDDAHDTARLSAYRRNRVTTLHVPPLTEATCERILAHGDDLMTGLPDTPPAELLASVRDQARGDASPGAAFLLFHRLARFADPLADYRPGGARSTLDQHVDRVRETLADVDPVAVDVATLCALLAAAGVGVTAGHCYALAARDDVDAATVQAAVEYLEGDVLFDGERGDGYRTIQRTWAVRYLERLADVEGEGAPRQFGRAVSGLFALADDPEARERVARAVGGDASVLDAVLADPGAWADDHVRSCFEVGLEYPKLAPLYGTTDGSAIDLPSAVSASTETRCVEWRGRMNAAHGAFDRAEREFDRLGEAADRLDGPLCQRTRLASLLGRCGVARQRGAFDEAHAHGETALSVAESLDDQQAVGRARLGLGLVASERSDFEAAQTHLAAALDAFEDDEALAHGAVWDELAEIAMRRGDYDRAHECYAESEAIYAATGNTRGTARSLANAGDVAFQREDYETAVERFRQARDLARRTGDRSHESDVLESMGASTFLQGDVPGALEYYEEALAIARDIDERRRVASILSDVGAVNTYRGERAVASGHYDEALAIAETIDAEELVVKCLRTMVDLSQQRGDLDAATEHARKGIEIARDIGNRQFEATCLRKLALCMLRQGRPTAAVDRLGDALALAAEMDDLGAQALAVTYLHDVAVHTGDLDAAQAHARAYARLTELLPADRSVGMPPAALLGLVALERGDVTAARDRFQRANDGDVGHATLGPALRLARAERRLGDTARARELVETASENASRPTQEVRCTLERGRLAMAAGDHADAAAAFETAAETADGVDRPLGTLVSCHRADLARRRGDGETAVDRFRRAFDQYREYGADRRAAQVAASLATVDDDPDSSVSEWAARGEDYPPGPWRTA